MLASLEVIYRIERQWRKAAGATNLLGAAAVLTGYRATGAVLFAISILCQIISWRAMRAAQRAHEARMQRAVL